MRPAGRRRVGRVDVFVEFLQAGAAGNLTWGNLAMLAVGCLFIWLAIARDYEPLLLVPIGFGILVGNIPFREGMNLSVYEDGSVLSILYQGIRQGYYPPLIFLGIGAMTDFSAMLSQPRLILLSLVGMSRRQPEPHTAEHHPTKNRDQQHQPQAD